MYRTHTCGELRQKNINEQITLAGWVQTIRNFGGMTFIDVRDRYGVTQLFFDEETNPELCEEARKCNREYVIQAVGTVRERSNKNSHIPTGDVEMVVEKLVVLSASALPPFTIEEETDGGEELRMKYRYLDLRRSPIQQSIIFRHKVAQEVRNYLDKNDFLEIETPTLIKSTPEGARDFIVPSRMNEHQFYALPQSPQTFKQLLMVSGFDRYFQIVKCYRDEDLRADRQPEFTQVDCELAFVEQEDVLNIFEGLTKYLLKQLKGFEMKNNFHRMTYKEAMESYGNDKPDMRFEMLIKDITKEAQSKDFAVFNKAEYVGSICAKGCANYTRKKLDALTDFVRQPQIEAKGLVYVKYNEDGSLKSSVDKFFTQDDLITWANKMGAAKGDLLLVLAGDKTTTLNALGELRLEMGTRLNLQNKEVFVPLWVTDFPLLEWDEETQRYYAKHHPFTSPKKEDISLLESEPNKMRANAYDLVINGVEIGGGSIRIHDRELQSKVFHLLDFTKEEAKKQFGFLMDAFKYGAPPHGGIALGFDRLVAMLWGTESIRDVIAFPKNNAGRDVMIDAPSKINKEQLKELNIKLN